MIQGLEWLEHTLTISEAKNGLAEWVGSFFSTGSHVTKKAPEVKKDKGDQLKVDQPVRFRQLHEYAPIDIISA